MDGISYAVAIVVALLVVVALLERKTIFAFLFFRGDRAAAEKFLWKLRI